MVLIMISAGLPLEGMFEERLNVDTLEGCRNFEAVRRRHVESKRPASAHREVKEAWECEMHGN